MMTKRNMRRGMKAAILVLLLCLLALAPMMGALAESAGTSAATLTQSKVADPGTAREWTKWFGPAVDTTANAGTVWTDKSVYTNLETAGSDGIVTSYTTGSGENAPTTSIAMGSNNFLVALSAIASNKSITGYEHIPTDTVIVLDMSSSMQHDIDELVNATNAALTQLLKLNNNNRVGVVIYSGNEQNTTGASAKSVTTVLMPLARYTTNQDNPYLIAKKDNGYQESNRVAVNSGVYKNGESYNKERKWTTGTYTQDGIYVGMNEFLNAATTVEDTDNYQSGVSRMPVLVLMTDGNPTMATTQFAGNDGELGNNMVGLGSTNMAFLTQLTASYARTQIEKHYGKTMLFYTLGFNINKEDNPVPYSVMNPAHSTDELNARWTDYLDNGIQLKNGGNSWTVSKNADAVSKNYVDAYYEATSNNMSTAFNAIVQQIILQSLYYPTQAEPGMKDVGGYVEFLDDIGMFMEVKQIHGVEIGGKLYSGVEFAKALTDEETFGTTEDPTDVGDRFVWSVQERMNIASVQDARDLISYAWQHGHLAYTSDSNYSNYIGWYAKADGSYLKHTASGEAPADAKYYIRSYGMFGAQNDETGLRKTDLFYITIRVEKNLVTGEEAVVWRVPASLIPLFSYKVTLDQNDSVSSVTKGGSSAPIRLLYEVGLRSDITPYNFYEKIAETESKLNLFGEKHKEWEDSDKYKYKNNNGTYDFYTNRWNAADSTNDGNSIPDALEDHPTNQINMVSWFVPSKENERYYYTTNSTVYTKSGNTYTPYEGNKPDSGTYYRGYTVFKKNDSGSWIQETRYEEISAAALSSAKQGDNTWYIPIGQIHRTNDPYIYYKVVPDGVTGYGSGNNATETLNYVAYPTVEEITGSSEYYADVILGNNGKLTVTQPVGLRVKKVVSQGDTSTLFTITIQGPTDMTDGSYKAQLTKADGTTENTTVSFTDGLATIQLSHDQELHIVGLPAGKTFTITEPSETLPANWKLKTTKLNGTTQTTNQSEPVNSVNVTTIVGSVPSVVFTNEIIPGQELILEKAIDPASHPIPSTHNPDFTFKVTLTPPTGTNLKQKYETSRMVKQEGSNAAVPEEVIIHTDAENEQYFTINLHAYEKVTVKQIAAGTRYLVEEIGTLPTGFEIVTGQAQDTINTDSVDTATITNKYTPLKPTSPPDVAVNIGKLLVGRPWLAGESFTFKLERLGADGSWLQIGSPATIVNAQDTLLDSQSAALTSDAANAALTAALKQDISKITHAGEYSYHIHEVIPDEKLGGLTYSDDAALITVVVEDISGQLTVTNVIGAQLASVDEKTENNMTTWTVSATFTNRYAITEIGEGEINLHIVKKVVDRVTGEQIHKDQTGNDVISYANFAFELYDHKDERLDFALTDENGVAQIHYEGIKEPLTKAAFTLKEDNSGAAGVGYDTTEWTIVVSAWDNYDGTYSTQIHSVTPSKDHPLHEVVSIKSADTVEGLTFINTFDQKRAWAELDILKRISNIVSDKTRSPKDFAFVLTDENGAVITDHTGAPIRAVSDANGKATLRIEFAEKDVGKPIHYLLVEEQGNEPFVAYSKQAYPVKFEVLRLEGGKLGVRTTSDDVGADVLTFEFENIYGDPEWLGIPETGDDNSLLLHAFIALLAVSGAVLLRRRAGKRN